MPNLTKKYGLIKPLPEEFYDIAIHNTNMDTLDDHNHTPEQIGAIPSKVKNYDTNPKHLEISVGDHWHITNEYDSTVPNLPVESNYTHYITINDVANVVVNVLSVPVDYTTDVYYFTKTDGKWHRLVDASNILLFTATVTTNWTADGDFFYQDIAVEGILDTDRPVVDVLMGSDNMANVTYCETFCKIFRITTLDNSIRVWATEAIDVAFPIQLRVVR